MVDVFFVDSSSLAKDSLIAYFMIRVINIQQEQVKHWHKENWIRLVSLIVCSKYFVICQLTAKVPTLPHVCHQLKWLLTHPKTFPPALQQNSLELKCNEILGKLY